MGSKCQQERSALPGLSTLPSFSSSGAAAESCSTPKGLFQAPGASHGQGPGATLSWVKETGARKKRGAAACFTSRAPDRLAPSGQGLLATGPARRVQSCPWFRRSSEAGGSSAGPGDRPTRRASTGTGGSCLQWPSPRACAARPRLREKRALKRASPRPGARDRGRGAGIGASWKVTAAGARREGRSTMGAGSRGRRPPPPPQRRAGFPERSGLEPRVCCRRCGQPGAANRRARDPRFPRAAGREPLCGDRRRSALAGAGVRAPG